MLKVTAHPLLCKHHTNILSYIQSILIYYAKTHFMYIFKFYDFTLLGVYIYIYIKIRIVLTHIQYLVIIIMINKKTCCQVDLAVPVDHREKIKESKKRSTWTLPEN